jgi:hypothetical protein
MTWACFHIHGALVRVVTDVEEATSLLDLGRYGPMVASSGRAGSPAAGPSGPAGPGGDHFCSDDHFRLVYRDRRRVSLRWDGRRELVFEAPWNLVGLSPALGVLGGLIARRALEARGRFVLHAAAVSRRGKAVVLYGGAGAGKTITAITLCRSHGFDLISNGTAVLGLDGQERPLALGTLKSGVKLRYSSFKRSFAAEADRLFCPPRNGRVEETQAGRAAVALDPAAGFDAKRTISGGELSLRVESGPVPLGAFYHLRLLPGPARAGPLDPVRLRVELYESLSRHVRGAATFLALGEDYRMSVYVPSLDSPVLHEARRQLIEAIVALPVVEGLVGGPSDAAAHVLASFGVAGCGPRLREDADSGPGDLDGGRRPQ